MINNKRMFLFFSLSFVVILLIAAGCGETKAPTGDDRVVAKVNNYEMTIADFKEGLETTPLDNRLAANSLEAKNDVLESLITKRVLLQAAQKENFDKEKAFMREIERHWEQALLKLLFKKKSYELSRHILIADSEVISEYKNEKRKIFAEIIILKDNSAAERLSASADKFDATKESVRDRIASKELAEWWVLGDLPAYLEEPLFSLKAGEVSRPIKSADNWAVIRALKEEELDIGPFEKAAPKVREHIMRKKKEEAFEKWISSLRKGANVKIDKKILEEVETK